MAWRHTEENQQKRRQGGEADLYKVVDCLHVCQVVIVDVHTQAEEEPSIPSVHNLKSSKLTTNASSSAGEEGSGNKRQRGGKNKSPPPHKKKKACAVLWLC